MTSALQEIQKSMGIRRLTTCKILAVSPQGEGSAEVEGSSETINCLQGSQTIPSFQSVHHLSPALNSVLEIPTLL